MEDRNTPINFTDYTVVGSGKRTIAKNFMANVFLWMFAALAISAFCAFLFASNKSLMSLLINPATGGFSLFGYITAFAPLIFVLTMSFAFNRLSASLLVLFFIAYAAVTGMSLSFLLIHYTTSSVIGCFTAASLMFGIMAVMGYTTDKDLTSFGRILTMGLIGIVIASIINVFLGSDRMGYIISIVGVAVFTGLTAYDVQKLKRIGEGVEFEGTSASDTKKLAIMGALNLYLDFINLFLMLLRLFGGRRD
jgi:FtsH-binding integral membrane protein